MSNWRNILFVLVGSVVFLGACKTESKKEIKTKDKNNENSNL